MCGIAGIWHLNNSPLERGKLQRFTDAMLERGPDAADYALLNGNTLGLGHRRLSILDLSDAAKQPMFYAEKRFSMVFNGEVFNFQEIRQELEKSGFGFVTNSDSEVVMAAYQKWGIECLHKFNGMWAIAIWDAQTETLFLARDRFGIKPFYYYCDANLFAFASETRAFKALEGFQREIDQEMVELQVAGARIHGSGHSIYKNIKSILPGHYAILTREKKFEQKRWWHIQNFIRKDIPTDLREQAAEFYSIFKDACRLRLISDVNVATALSGGVDSTSVYSVVFDLMKNESLQRVPKDAQKAFVATFPGLISDEREYAEKALKYTGGDAVFVEQKSDNLVEQIVKDTQIFDGLNNSPITAISGIYRSMKQSGITVSMDGHGVDEMLYGYRDMIYNLFYYYYKKGNFKQAEEIKNVLIPTYHLSERDQALLNVENLMYQAQSPFTQLKAVARRILKPKQIDRTEYAIPEKLRSLGEPYDFSGMNLADRAVYNETFIETLPDIFRNFDLAAMMNSVEIRMPFMDWRLVSFIFSLPLESKIGNGFTKLIVREAMQGKMSEEIRTRTHKIGISSPSEHWFNGTAKEWAYGMLQQIVHGNQDKLYAKTDLQKLLEKWKHEKLNKSEITKMWWELNLKILDN